MRLPSARISDLHVCPLVNPGPVPHVGGPISQGFPTVLVGGLPTARVGDLSICTGPPDPISVGTCSVFVGGSIAARMLDMTAHGGKIVGGCPTVLIGTWQGNGSPAGPQPGLSQQMNALLSAQRNGSPFCEQCEECQQAADDFDGPEKDGD